MKPTVISNVNTSDSTGSGNLQTGGHSVTIPINQDYRGQINNQHFQQPDFITNVQHDVIGDPIAARYGSPGSVGRGQRQQQPQESPLHYQDFDFDSNAGLDMFPRSRLGRMTHDPFGDFGSNSRKRSSLHDPHFHTDGFSRYFDDGADFGFPQFNSLGRRRINPHNDDDFFNRLPSEFRQYIPESFAHRHAGSGMTGSGPTMVETQQPAQQPHLHSYNVMPQSPSRKVCDAAIQTEDPSGRSEVDHESNAETLDQNYLHNTMDMGVKSSFEKENQCPRSSSAPPTELQQNIQQTIYTPSQQIPLNSSNPPTTPTQLQDQFATQTSPHIQSGSYGRQSPQFQKMFSSPQGAHSQHKQQTPPPQTPSGSYIRTIPIFVEGRKEPIINNKEIPHQTSQATADDSRAFTPPKQQPKRPTPLNTQQKNTTPSSGLPPQTPHTVDTINKIQNIQRDVLDLMSRVEKFAGTRADKEYVYLDEMLTRNLLKLDNIETNGKDSIRLARKEAIKCIQASINVLEAKAEENKKAGNMKAAEEEVNEKSVQESASPVIAPDIQKSASQEKTTKESKQINSSELVVEPAENKNTPIPLPAPESEKFNEVKIEDCPEDDLQAACTNDELTPKTENTSNDFSKSQ